MARLPCERELCGVNVCMWTFREALRVEIETHEMLPCELVVSTQVPDEPSEWIAGIECPHGIMYWIEPTPETIAAWERGE